MKKVRECVVAMVCFIYGVLPLVSLANLEIVAHRGASHEAPENTLAAFNLAWRQGVDAIEGDFHLTKDGRIVCIHDETTSRTADKDLAVAASSLAQLRQLDVGSWKDRKWSGEQIPTIEEVLATVPQGKKIFIEIKCGPEIIEPLKDALARSGLKPEQTIVISFNETVVARTKKQFPYIKVFWLTSYKKEEKTGEWKPSLRQILNTLKRINADGLGSKAHSIVDQHFVKAVREANMEFNVWTVDEATTAQRFRNLGVDSLTTNRPGWLRGQLTELLKAK